MTDAAMGSALLRPRRFDGRTAVVTGGAGGIGSEVCHALASEGANVAVVDVDNPSVDDTVESLRKWETKVTGAVVDVRDPAAVGALMQTVHDRLGGPHVLVTLAGGSLGTPRDLGEISPADVDRVVDVNVKGTFYCCQSATPFMAESGGGSIVTISSIGGRQPSPVTGVPYATSKAAVVGLTKRLAREVGAQGIRVNAVAPGLFLTGRLQRRYDEMAETDRREVLDAIPLNRFPRLHEVVDPILFLASDEASYVTGVVLDVNGGRFMPL